MIDDNLRANIEAFHYLTEYGNLLLEEILLGIGPDECGIFRLDVFGIKVTIPRLPVFCKDILPIVIYTESQHRRNITTAILYQLAAFKTVTLMIDDAILRYQINLVGTGGAAAL